MVENISGDLVNRKLKAIKNARSEHGVEDEMFEHFIEARVEFVAGCVLDDRNER